VFSIRFNGGFSRYRGFIRNVDVGGTLSDSRILCEIIPLYKRE
jgi:hypothetical protein